MWNCEQATERTLLEKVGHVMTSIKESTHVDQLISTLHSLTSLIFTVDSHSILGIISEEYRDEVRNVEILSEDERRENWKMFYGGAAFRTLARVLLYGNEFFSFS
ncbi:hypothetical protein LIER_43989 [Lithospermum erythrorhizon]|uniref:Uncharacterized protein n=1 Tax=Lithospermum erythrorhizon TaxID=34254 RepID=A0AAV3RFG0_LITER